MGGELANPYHADPLRDLNPAGDDPGRDAGVAFEKTAGPLLQERVEKVLRKLVG